MNKQEFSPLKCSNPQELEQNELYVDTRTLCRGEKPEQNDYILLGAISMKFWNNNTNLDYKKNI